MIFKIATSICRSPALTRSPRAVANRAPAKATVVPIRLVANDNRLGA